MSFCTPRIGCRRGFSLLDALVAMAIVIVLLAVSLPVLAASNGGMGIAGSKRNLMQIGMAHQMYAADHNGNQWVNVAHDLATFGDTYQSALSVWIDSLGGTSHPMVSNATGQWMTFLGWGIDPSSGTIGLWRFPWNIYTMPIHFDSTAGAFTGFGYHRMMNVRAFNPYLNGKVYDRTFYAPKHSVALINIGDCFDGRWEFCLDENFSTYWSSYSLSPAALLHPDMWSTADGEFPESMDAIFAQFDNAFHALPYDSAKYPDLKTHVMENVWLQNNYVGPCSNQNPMPAFGSYGGCASYLFNSSIHSSPVTLFYDGHVRLLPLTEVKAADDKIGVWRRDTPMGENGFFQEFGVPGDDNPQLSHHILTNGGILGRDTLGPSN
jgi:type II secretory pathway pseudopilin PulG